MSGTVGRTPRIALACGVLAVIAAFLMYWMVLVSVGFGVVAVTLGVRIRRTTDHAPVREIAMVAIALGLVGIIGTAGSFMVADGAEDYGRDCALHPEDQDC